MDRQTDRQTDIPPLAIPAVCIARYANALVKSEKLEIMIILHVTFYTVKIRDISLSRIEPFRRRDTASKFGTVPKNLGRLATRQP